MEHEVATKAAHMKQKKDMVTAINLAKNFKLLGPTSN